MICQSPPGGIDRSILEAPPSSLSMPCLSAWLSLLIHCAFPAYPLGFPCLCPRICFAFPAYRLCFPCLSAVLSLLIRCAFPVYPLSFPCLSAVHSLLIHSLWPSLQIRFVNPPHGDRQVRASKCLFLEFYAFTCQSPPRGIDR